MRILFAGTNVPNEIEYQTKNISAAGNRFQNNMLMEMRKQGTEAYNLAYLAIPMDDKCLEKVRGNRSANYAFIAKQEHGDGLIGVLKSVRAYHGALKEKIHEVDAVMCYNVNYAWLKLPGLAKKNKKKSVLILADYSGPECFRSAKGKLYAHAMKRAIRQFDIVVGLSSQVENILKPEQKFMLMEGGIDESFYHEFDSLEEVSTREEAPKREYRIMYSGLLSKVTGIDQLIDVMDYVAEQRKDIRLVISGKGDLEGLIWEKQKIRPWLEYLGHVPYQQYIEELKKADLLVNPRNMDLPENANNFPSKILDYLATGKQILSTKFTGWERFKDAISFCEMEKWDSFLIDDAKQGKKPSLQVFERNRAMANNYLWNRQITRLIEQIKK